MFKNRGDLRTHQQNLQIASLLSFVAGMVNVAGFLSVQRLTTNVTGHFAFMVDEVFKLQFLEAINYFFYVFFFLVGAFVSGFLIELTPKSKEEFSFVVPAVLEAAILSVLPFFGPIMVPDFSNAFACVLLFSMGLQNALVTSISNSVVRTTHLTGLFTDLGIELSQLFFYKRTEQREKLFRSIRLRITIISFFFIGGIVGGTVYSFIQLFVLLVAGLVLFIGIAFDYLHELYERAKLFKGSD